MQKIVQILVVFVMSVSGDQEAQLTCEKTCKSQTSAMFSFFDQLKEHIGGFINTIQKQDKDLILQTDKVSFNA